MGYGHAPNIVGEGGRVRWCRVTPIAATPKFEVKRHGASDYSNDCRAVSPGSYSASNIAGSAPILDIPQVAITLGYQHQGRARGPIDAGKLVADDAPHG